MAGQAAVNFIPARDSARGETNNPLPLTSVDGRRPENVPGGGPAPTVTRVAVAGGDGVTRWALKAVLSQAPEVVVCATVATQEELDDITADVVVILAHCIGCPAVKAWLDRLRGRARTLLISDDATLSNVVAVLAGDAAGYVTPDVPPEVLATAVRAVSDGGVYLTQRVSRVLADALRPHASLRSTVSRRLSAREREALLHIVGGLTHAQAARLMGVQKPTVDTYIERVRTKLGASNKAALVRQAIELSMVHDRGLGRDGSAPAP